MIAERSPLEMLLAFVICYAAGVLTSVAMSIYAKQVRKQAQSQAGV